MTRSPGTTRFAALVLALGFRCSCPGLAWALALGFRFSCALAAGLALALALGLRRG